MQFIKKSYWLAVGFLVFSLCLTPTVYAQTAFKMGYVSLDRLLAESAPAKQARTSLDKQFKSRERALDKKAADIRTQQQEYEKNFPKLNDAQRAEREQIISKAVESFDSERTAFETELSNAQNQLLQDLLKKANMVIRGYAEQEGFDFIVQDAVYIKPAYDITPQILELLK